MKNELEQELYKIAPDLYANRDGSPRETLMCFGFECGDGWFNLLKEASEKIQAHLNTMNARDRAPFRAAQVKEKYGTLRFYTDSTDDVIENIIREAESKSETTCEYCGQPGTTRGGGWVKTQCEKCYIMDFISRMTRECLYHVEEYDKEIEWGEKKGQTKKAFRFKGEGSLEESIYKILTSKFNVRND